MRASGDTQRDGRAPGGTATTPPVWVLPGNRSCRRAHRRRYARKPGRRRSRPIPCPNGRSARSTGPVDARWWRSMSECHGAAR